MKEYGVKISWTSDDRFWTAVCDEFAIMLKLDDGSADALIVQVKHAVARLSEGICCKKYKICYDIHRSNIIYWRGNNVNEGDILKYATNIDWDIEKHIWIAHLDVIDMFDGSLDALIARLNLFIPENSNLLMTSYVDNMAYELHYYASRVELIN